MAAVEILKSSIIQNVIPATSFFFYLPSFGERRKRADEGFACIKCIKSPLQSDDPRLENKSYFCRNQFWSPVLIWFFFAVGKVFNLVSMLFVCFEDFFKVKTSCEVELIWLTLKKLFGFLRQFFFRWFYIIVCTKCFLYEHFITIQFFCNFYI